MNTILLKNITIWIYKITLTDGKFAYWFWELLISIDHYSVENRNLLEAIYLKHISHRIFILIFDWWPEIDLCRCCGFFLCNGPKNSTTFTSKSMFNSTHIAHTYTSMKISTGKSISAHRLRDWLARIMCFIFSMYVILFNLSVFFGNLHHFQANEFILSDV